MGTLDRATHFTHQDGSELLRLEDGRMEGSIVFEQVDPGQEDGYEVTPGHDIVVEAPSARLSSGGDIDIESAKESLSALISLVMERVQQSEDQVKARLDQWEGWESVEVSDLDEVLQTIIQEREDRLRIALSAA